MGKLLNKTPWWVFFLLFTHLPLHAQTNNVKISGKLINAKSVDGSYAYVVTGGSAETVRFHQGKIKDNSFTVNLQQDYKDTLVFSFLFISPLSKMNDKVYRENLKSYKRHTFVLDTAEIKVTIDYVAKWAAVKGGELNRHKREFDLIDSVYFKMGKERKLEEQYVHSGNFLTDLNRFRNLAWIDLIQKHNTSLYSISILASLANLPVPGLTYQYRNEIREALENLPAEVQKTYRVKKIYESFEENLKRNAPKDGQLFPNIQLVGSNSEPVTFQDLYGSKEYLLVDFWATWCGPCIQQHPDVKKLADKFQNSNIQVVGISVDQKLPSWSNYLKKHDFNYPQYRFDPADKEMLTTMGALKLPTYTLVEKSSGKIVEYDIPINELEKTLEKYRK